MKGELRPRAFIPAPGFILFGTEQSMLRVCTNPTFTTRPVGLEGTAAVSGASWGDYDKDGYDDLFVSAGTSILYRNSNGQFRNAMNDAGLPHLSASSAVFADFDANRYPDLLVADYVATSSVAYTRPRLFLNDHGHFTEATHEYGLDAVQPLLGGARFSLADYDGDGRVDILMASEGLFRIPIRAFEQPFYKAKVDPFFAGKKSFNLVCGSDVLTTRFESYPTDPLRKDFQNAPSKEHACLVYSTAVDILAQETARPFRDAKPLTERLLIPGDVRLLKGSTSSFAEVVNFEQSVRILLPAATSTALLQNEPTNFVAGRFFQPVSFDYDGDGRQDIFLTSDYGRNILLHNDGSLHFTDVSMAAGFGYFSSGMGASVGDVNNDGLPDIAVTNTTEDYIFVNRGDGTFANDFDRDRVAKNKNGWWISFLDYDGDGDLDIAIANGSINAYDNRPDFAQELSRPLFRTNDVYENQSGHFVDAAGSAICTPAGNSRALAVADADNDGTPDIFFGAVKTGDVLYTNSATRTYLAVRLIGRVGNSDAFGARVSLRAGTTTQTRFVLGGNSFGSQDSEKMLFAIPRGEHSAVIDVVWPSGRTREVVVTSFDRAIDIRE